MEIIATSTLHRGAKFDLAEHALRAADGSIVRREFVDHPGAVVILPLLVDGRIVMLRNYRHSLDDVIWELPAGTRAPGEPPEVTAQRELIEEAGYQTSRLERLLEYFPAPGISNEAMTVYLAEELAATPTARECDESMEVHVLPAATVLSMARAGAIRDGKTLIALWAWQSRV